MRLWLPPVLLCALLTAAAAGQALGPPLWRLGQPDDSSAEFADYHTANPDIVTLPASAATVSKGLRADRNPALEINFDLAATPAHGAMFGFKLLAAPKSGAQMAVFSNGLMAGLIQLWGTAGSASRYPWRKTYRLYLPPELLSAGRNVLRLETVRPLWSDAGADRQIWWEWDDLWLAPLTQAAREPIHGTVAYLGTTMKHNGSGFDLNDDTLRLAPVALEWMGVAYSGNTLRADFWSDLPATIQPRRLEYLQLLRDLNCTVVVDNVSGSHYTLGRDGQIPPAVKAKVEAFFAKYGGLFQYFELGNEPCVFGGGYAEYLALARYIDQVKPASVKLAAPGWAYGGGKGTPVNWDANVALRRRIEALCQLTNGHSYGYSYADDRGGSFMENLRTYEGVEDGWPKEFLTTETGSNNWHSETNGPRLPSSQPHAQAFDRILRAHIAVVDRAMQHAAIFDDFGLFKAPANWADCTTLTAYPGVGGEDTRLKTYRRLALAYATHGAPLAYTVLNREAAAGRKVYFRAVDTAALPALPGSGGTSDKVLLNFVNFENAPATLKVRVTLPRAGHWTGVRFGAGDSYRAARSEVTIEAAPAVELSADLGPGEAVQYILKPPGPSAPYAPLNLAAAPAEGAVVLTWSGCSGAASYAVAVAESADGPWKEALSGLGEPRCTITLANGQRRWFKVTAANAAGASPASEAVSGVAGAPDQVVGLEAQAGDGRVTLTWSAAARAAGYLVERAAGAAGPFAKLAAAAAPPYVDTAVTNGAALFYRVRATNGSGDGAPSESVAATPQAPPPAPTGLTAAAGDHRVALRWTPTPGATFYVVKRAAPGEAATVIASDLPAAEFVDAAAANGTAYNYRVAAQDQGPVGPDSAALSVTPAAEPLPAPWVGENLGRVGAKGKASFNPNGAVFAVQGSGDDIWAAADGGYFAHRPLTGDGAITAHVAATENTHGFCKVGVMMRASTAPGAPMAMVHLSPNGAGCCWRQVADGPCEMAGGDAKPWLRLVRAGDTLRGFVSDDGQNWKPRGVVTMTLPAEVLVGLMVCSHNNGQLDHTLFDQVTVTQGKDNTHG
jgi:regulation of enolase protein 1 (concanavalin A-like superfamily)